MESTIKQRLDILKQADQITEKMELAITTLLEKLEDTYQLKVTEENGAMLVMHLAIALARIERGETVARMDEVVIDQIRGAKGFDELPEFLGDLEREMGWKIPAEEFEYIALHFCTMIEKGGRA
jgi:transcriptional regulatory protein LevR